MRSAIPKRVLDMRDRCACCCAAYPAMVGIRTCLLKKCAKPAFIPCTHERTHTRLCALLHFCAHARTHAHACMRIHANALMHACAPVHLFAPAHTRVCTRAHARVRAHTHSYVCVRRCSVRQPNVGPGPLLRLRSVPARLQVLMTRGAKASARHSAISKHSSQAGDMNVVVCHGKKLHLYGAHLAVRGII